MDTLNNQVFRLYSRLKRKFTTAMIDISTSRSSLCRRINLLNVTKKMDERLVIQGTKTSIVTRAVPRHGRTT